MIPDHLIDKALDAWIGDHNCPHPDLIHVYRVLITRSLEAVAPDIWADGYAACYARQLQSDLWPYADEDEQAEKEYAEACGRNAATRAPNPYRASETA